ncbi:MAG: restriction endonuclease [Betaproteobacteria bacterium]|nr:restriction endonuclease [Betaproteobacteria bacterium]MDE2153006.1 restriction endonuclease [Betaproteobacteria bacterium]
MAVVIGVPVYGIDWLYNNTPWALAIVLGVIVLGIAAYVYDKRRRRGLFDLAAFDIWTLSPTGYERYCATILEKFGWRTKLTKASGDHVVDVVAELAAVKVAIQIKQYCKRVRNAAVQQVVAGKAIYGCAAAACVAPNGYTPIAEQLARANGVLPMRHRDLPGLPSTASWAAPDHSRSEWSSKPQRLGRDYANARFPIVGRVMQVRTSMNRST